MCKPTIFLFAYDFSHEKSCRFMEIISKYNFDVTVLAAPKKILKHNKSFTNESEVFNTKVAAKKFGFNFIPTEHDNNELFKGLIKNKKNYFGLISGARILSKQTLSTFKKPVINFHPGKIPETSGLDSFYWMIKNNVPPGTTVHEIDEKIDAGKEFFFHSFLNLIPVDIDKYKDEIFNNQFFALSRLLSIMQKGFDFPLIQIDRPFSNKKMSNSEILDTKNIYPNYRASLNKKLANISQAYELVKNDLIDELKLIHQPYLINFKNNEGRTLLSEACYYKSLECVKYLLKIGYDPNTQNDNGTIPLMYSKTIIENKNQKSIYEIIDQLLKYGADPFLKDHYQRDLFYYLDVNKQRDIIRHIKNAVH